MVKNNQNFDKIIEPMSFESFLTNFTVLNFQSEFSHKRKRSLSEDEHRLSTNNVNPLLISLANAVANPNVINLILENLINNHEFI